MQITFHLDSNLAWLLLALEALWLVVLVHTLVRRDLPSEEKICSVMVLATLNLLGLLILVAIHLVWPFLRKSTSVKVRSEAELKAYFNEKDLSR